ncbi:recombinase [Pseudoflavonifractor sp. 524-17]|uniref:recombinase family protein n=1 Tax=Pseudoflavonifractor sp. 524-17 TaxID=2304577 RepID=UPI001379E660|nr:recombinase family protein [Pseudoflavonifractor sp. 524-17]NCE64443.1 recombinase [Pseudoflavonifractor sp. 524-17]
MQKTAQAKIWNATLYLRLSREDGDKEESNSIAGQRNLLRDFLKQHPDIREYAVQVDDGWSGSTFERPSFKKMMEDVKAGKTNCIVVKDLSRFGRNYLDAGEYIEKIFPFMGVRFIAVNDNYDSYREKSASDDLIVPFKNLINEAYCRDISVKIRSQLEIKRKNGQFLGAFAAYGYFKAPQDKNSLVIDEYAAEVVREIFAWKVQGISPQDIANRLNAGGILSPLEYKRSLGMKCSTPLQTNLKASWSAASVIRLLKNPIYIGTLTQGRATTPSYKVHKRVKKAESEWSVIENNHAPIVSRKDFDTVQKVLALDTRRSPDEESVSLFSGMVFCGDCGASMIRKPVSTGGRKYHYYICSANKQDKTCSPHRIRLEVLEQIIFDCLKERINAVAELENILEIADTAPLRTAGAVKVQRQLDEKRAEYEKLQKLLLSLYENLADGIIDRAEYTRLKESFSQRAAEAEKQMDALRERIEVMKTSTADTSWTDNFKCYRNLTELDRTAVVSMIDRIMVYEDNTVEIVYRWQDEFAWQMDIVRQAQIREAV